MLSFGLGAGLPLAALGLLARGAVLRWRTRMMLGGARAKTAFAILLVMIGVLVVTGFDKQVETLVVNDSPLWLTELTTRF
jgi:cytochrome c-type biogenesis protein